MPLAHRNFRTAHIQKEVECNITTFCWCLNRDWVNKLMHVTFCNKLLIRIYLPHLLTATLNSTFVSLF